MKPRTQMNLCAAESAAAFTLWAWCAFHSYEKFGLIFLWVGMIEALGAVYFMKQRNDEEKKSD